MCSMLFSVLCIRNCESAELIILGLFCICLFVYLFACLVFLVFRLFLNEFLYLLRCNFKIELFDVVSGYEEHQRFSLCYMRM